MLQARGDDDSDVGQHGTLFAMSPPTSLWKCLPLSSLRLTVLSLMKLSLLSFHLDMDLFKIFFRCGAPDEVKENRVENIMPMNEVQKYVTTTWAAVEGVGLEAAGIDLFKNIFAIAPEALQLFSFKDEKDLYNSDGLKAHAVGVMKAVGMAVASLDDLERLAPKLKSLGKLHVGKGVLPEHYQVVGEALIKTLQSHLKEAFTEDVKAAWIQVYGVVQENMISDNYA